MLTRDEVIQIMGQAVHEYCSIADAMIVQRALLEQPERMVAYLNSDKRTWTARDFAWFALRCAKRVFGGGPS